MNDGRKQLSSLWRIVASIVGKGKDKSRFVLSNFLRTLRLYFFGFGKVGYFLLRILALKAANLFEEFRHTIVYNCWRILHGGLKLRWLILCQFAECLNVIGDGFFHIEVQ